MKLIKKLTTILFVFMMVLSATTMVFAEGNPTEGTSTGTRGTIKIDNAIVNETYKVYRVFDLESYDATNKRYAYKPNASWKTFLTGTEIKGVYVEFFDDTDLDGYVKWKDGADVKEFAKKALKYARENSIAETANAQAATATVTFSNLDLGYYLVDSGVGALCTLNTTNPEVTIKEKNDRPTITKQVQEDSDSSWGDNNSAEIGETVKFKVEITAKPGAQNYVLYDKMDTGFTLTNKADGTPDIKVTEGSRALGPTDYSVDTTAPAGEDWTFKITFTDTYLSGLRTTLGENGGTSSEAKITVEYSALLNENAKTPGTTYTDKNHNNAWLKYGEDHQTNKVETHTVTFELPVFKYFKDTTGNHGLANAKFTLSKNVDGASPIELIKVSGEDATAGTELVYRLATSKDTTGKETVVTTPTSGKFKIVGLDYDTYYLTETEAPNGFNKLKKAVKIEMTAGGLGTFKIDDATTPASKAEIENKTGTLLPSTGGVGTTMMYIVGAALLIGSGVLLITKKNAK